LLSKVRREDALLEGLELAGVVNDIEGGGSNKKRRESSLLAFVSSKTADEEFER